jgi:hypothetical protein
MFHRVRELLHTLSHSTFDGDLLTGSRGLTDKKTDAFWGMNRQFIRTSILLKLLRALESDVFIETGTNVGRTCFLIAAQTKLPIYSSEVNREYLRTARRLLFPFGRKIQLFNEDSVGFLKHILTARTFRQPFFYLDAHWAEKLPLREELAVIFRECASFLIVVDDFAVPNDPGFGYDVYGSESLDFTLVRDLLSSSGAKPSVWFPSYSSELETGSRRGWVVIASADNDARIRTFIPEELLSLHSTV